MKKNMYAAVIAGVLIGALSIPVVNNLGLSVFVSPLVVGLVLWIGTVIGVWIGMMLRRVLPLLFEVVKFGVVGVLNTLVDFGVLNLLILIFSVASGVWFSLFKSLSFIVAVVNSYVWNKFWTFESDRRTNTKEALSFFVVSVIGFVVNVGIASLIVNAVPALFGANPVVWANVGALVGTLLAFTWNFVGYKFFVFRPETPNTSESTKISNS